MRTKLGLCLLAVAAWPLHAGEITGRIVLNDKPAAGVSVSALPIELADEHARREARRLPRPEPVAKAVTNAKGEFRIVFEAPGEPGRFVSLACSGGGVASSWIPGRFDSADVADAGEFEAQKGFSLRGKVLDASGRPVPDADVDHPAGPSSARTGADGAFVLEGVPESGNDVEARKAGFANAKALRVRGGRTDVTIVLKPASPLAGVVLSPDGSPAAGVVVRGDGRDSRAFAETDAGGRFSLASLGPGRVTVWADGGEKGFRESTGVAHPRRDDEPLRLVLAPAPLLNGRVLDATTKRPVAGAIVDAPGGRRVFTRAGADGSFALRAATSGDLRLFALAPGRVPGIRQVSSAEVGTKPVEILLRAAATLSGRVFDESRRPIAGVRIRCYDPEPRTYPVPPPSAVASEDGSFTLRRVAASETQRLLALHPDFEPFVLADLALKPGESRTGLALTLRRGAVVSGVVTAGGEPLANAEARLMTGRTTYGAPPRSLSGPFQTWPHAKTGPDGRFRIAGASPGDYVLYVSRTGWATESRDVTIADGKGPDPFSISLVPEGVIAGRFVGKKGAPVPDRDVNAQSLDAKERSYGSARSGPDGTFRIESLKPGVAYNLFIYGSGPMTPRGTATAPAERVDLVVDGTARISGRVLDADGRPVTAYQVVAQADRSAGSTGWTGSARQEVSSETGEFALETAPSGAVELRVTAKGFQAARLGGVVVEEGESKEGVEIRLVKGASVQGRVVEASGGAPVAGAEVSAESAPARAIADADGGFVIDGVAPGKVRLTATATEYASSTQTADVGESGATVELKMSSGASVSASVVTPGGEPAAGAEVVLAPAGQTWSNNRLPAGPDGRVRFRHLAPGRYTVTAGSAGRRSKPVDVTLEGDQARDDVRVVLGGGATIVVTVTGLSADERRQLGVGVSGKGYVAARELTDGRFEARDVPAGRAQVYVRTGSMDVPNARSTTKPVDVPEDGTLDVEVPFEGGYTLTVRVLKNGQPVEGVFLFAAPAVAGAATLGQGTTDASGTCRLSGLKAGSYRMNGWSPGADLREQKVDVSGDQTLDIVLPSGRLAGRVVASGSQQPLGNATVDVKAPSAEGRASAHSATTDDAGRFRFDGLESGPLNVTASKKGYVVDTRTVSADAPDDLEIALARGDGLDLIAKDGLLGTPLASASVFVYGAGGAEVVETNVRFDSAGRGEIPSLKPGTYAIVAGSWPGYAPGTYEGVSIPGPALAVSLTPGGTLDIDVALGRLAAGPVTCSITGPRGPLAFRTWGKRGELVLASATIHLPNFPPLAGTLACPGAAPIPFVVPEGDTTRIAVK